MVVFLLCRLDPGDAKSNQEGRNKKEFVFSPLEDRII